MRAMSISSRTTFHVPKAKRQEDLLSGIEKFDWEDLSEFRRIDRQLRVCERVSQQFHTVKVCKGIITGPDICCNRS